MIARPSIGSAGRAAVRSPSFMLVRNEHSIPPLDAINFADEAPARAFERKLQPVAIVLLAFDLDVKPPPGVNAGIGYAKILDFFEVKETFAVGEGVERVDVQKCIHY